MTTEELYEIIDSRDAKIITEYIDKVTKKEMGAHACFLSV